MNILCFLICFFASIIGGICGIGGGIIIKPLLDMVGFASVPIIAFLSSCSVLSMSLYNVSRSLIGGSTEIDLKLSTPLALGAALGGIAGNRAFICISAAVGNYNLTGATQSIILFVLVSGTLWYTLKKSQIAPKNLKGFATCIVCGFALGTVSSFLGIGGGPFNLVVLHYCFGMETKKAATNSLYVVLFSQITNVMLAVLTSTVPVLNLSNLILMCCGGICGGICGRLFSKKMSNEATDKLFVGLMVIIIIICIYNTVRYVCY